MEARPLFPSIPDFRRGDVALKYVKRGYHVLCTHFLTLLLVPVAITTALELLNMGKTGELKSIWQSASNTNVQFNLVTFCLCSLLLTCLALTYVLTRAKPVYLRDFHVFKPPDELKISRDLFVELSKKSGVFSEKAMQFQERIMEKSGLGDETYLPPGVRVWPPDINMRSAREEAEMVIYASVREALAKCRLRPSQIDILVVNCSLFNPTPSLSAMIVNHFKMRSNTITYNLGGMGCSAGVIAIGLAREQLQVYPNSTALVVSTENITQNWYFGEERSMLIPNCLFRIGGAAIVLSNRRQDRWSAKYELLHTVRTHMGASDANFGCVVQREDANGKVGVHLSRDLMAIAGGSLKANITTLGPLVLPYSEQLLFFFNLCVNLFVTKVLGRKKRRPYIPDFKLAFEHFCIHTGGAGVIAAIEEQLSLTPANVQPSKDALFRWGNVSSASIWYVLSNIESEKTVRRGDRVWQIAFGSGFKCNSAVWRALRHVHEVHPAWDDTVSVPPAASTKGS
jgi:3-ketoacyl-CoA synthase